MSILLFGYGKFLEFDENPSQLVVEALDGSTIADHTVRSVLLPVDYSMVEEKILTEINSQRADLVVGFGLAAGRNAITPEKVALNYRYAGEPDNTGRKLMGESIDSRQPEAMFTTLPVEGVVEFLRSKGIPAELSLSAGGYLCNNAMFVIVRESKLRNFAGGFIHIPCHSEWIASKQKSYPSLPLSTIKNAAEFALEYFVRHSKVAITKMAV